MAVFVFAFWNQSQATAPNVYLLLYPKPELRNALAKDSSLFGRVFDALQSLDTDDIKGDGRVYGGGLFKMEPKELAAIPAAFLTRALGIDLQAIDLVSQPNLFQDDFELDEAGSPPMQDKSFRPIRPKGAF